MTTQKLLPIVIIGTGLAGYTLAKELRKNQAQRPLVLITEDDGHFYSKPQLSTALAQGKTAQQLVITTVETMREQLHATIYTFSSVTLLDPATQTLMIQHQGLDETIRYEKLIFAIGAKPRSLPILHDFAAHCSVNNLREYADFMERVQSTKILSIIGSGLVACEFAYDFAHFKKISIISRDPWPLHQLVPIRIGEALCAFLEKSGIEWHLNTQIDAVDGPSNTLFLSSGKSLQSDVVLTAIGLEPNIALAKSAKLNTNRGIVVDAYLQSSDPNIFALGDCAEISGICRAYVAPILVSARALAQTLDHKPTKAVFGPMPISLKVSAYPVIVFPPTTTDGAWTMEEQPTGIKALFHNTEGKLQGYALSGSATQARQSCLQALTLETT